MTMLLALLMTGPMAVAPDVLPAGHRAVAHELILAEDARFEGERLVATPVRGFGGVEEVVPGRPFRFSTKYGTRLYLVPLGESLEDAPRAGEALPFPSGPPPVRETRSVPLSSSVRRVTTTFEMVGREEGALHFGVVEHLELDGDGNPVRFPIDLRLAGSLIAAGLALGLVVRRARRA